MRRKQTARKPKYDSRQTRSVMAALNAFSRRYGVEVARYAASRWVGGQRAKVRLLKLRKALKKELRDLTRRLSR
jgi:hypothetical protein